MWPRVPAWPSPWWSHEEAQGCHTEEIGCGGRSCKACAGVEEIEQQDSHGLGFELVADGGRLDLAFRKVCAAFGARSRFVGLRERRLCTEQFSVGA
ncbi:hypothetical protein EUGRSUZ_L02149 [Eucalyptus grandis]|uniref:Uncharacterized protein n=1 Tax=Eucalyptus grandis TaxID=71139 RepID=A0A058ZRE9_EUCGR|nr:hypothetical protein EUGRSUZ_L02149 [Eucalyptus grandis]